MKKEKCYGCKKLFSQNRVLFDYCSGNHFCLNCYKNQFTAISVVRNVNINSIFNY